MQNKRLQYTVRVSETNPDLASLLLEQFRGPAAAMRYFTQVHGESDPAAVLLPAPLAINNSLSYTNLTG